MKEDPSKKKTILNRNQWYKRKIGAIMTAVALAGGAMMMTGCDEKPDPDDSAYTESVTDTATNVPEDIANLDNASKTGDLVQGRQGCIDKLVKNGLGADEAGKVCDSIAAEAKAQIKAQQQQQQAQGTNTTVYVNNGNDDALLWYMIGANSRSPYIYYGSPSAGLTYYHTSYNNSTTVAQPPAHLNSVQSTYLATEHSMRPAVMSQLASRPGVKVVSVAHFTHDGTHFVTSHSSSTGHSSSISHGGFASHGVSTGG